MYDESKDEDDLEDIFEEPNAEDLGDLELQEMKSHIGNLEKKINAVNEKLGMTKRNIQLLTTTIKVEQQEDFKKIVEQVEEEKREDSGLIKEEQNEGEDDVDSDDEALAMYLDENKDSGSDDE